MKIAITIPGGSRNPNIWSGTPYSLHQALESLGHEVVSVDVAPPAKAGSLAVRLIKAINRKQDLSPAHARQTKIYNGLFSARGTLKVLSTRPDAVLQLGTGYNIHTSKPVVTFEDMTIKQAIAGG